MKKSLLLSIVLAFALTACGGGIKTTVGADKSQKAAQAVVEKWIAAYQKKDAQALLTLYTDDMTWSDCTQATCDQYHLSDLKAYAPSDFANPGFKMQPQSYFVTNYGYKAIVQALYSDPNVPVTNVPAVAILEINGDGKISSQTWYWAQP